jgi:putative ubiquitin-RnfH superfamily antitoxin RatB of RatAB toxin-antitoxin module
MTAVKPAPVKRCLVACDSESGVRLCEVELSSAASVADALDAARALLGEGIDWSGATGIWGRRVPREHVPADGERIELYRPLQFDPRERRRQRSRKRTGVDRP